jgi:hypothetical protein
MSHLQELDLSANAITGVVNAMRSMCLINTYTLCTVSEQQSAPVPAAGLLLQQSA